MIRVGITGGIGCGKSTVLAEFEKIGVPCFISDRAGADCYRNRVFLKELRQLFGDAVFLPDGSVDKKAIAARVFADHRLMEQLNRMVHPRVMHRFEQFCLQNATADYVLFESAILYDYGFDRMMDAVVCVYLDLEERISRLAVRDGVSRSQIMSRIAAQMPAEEVMMKADYVILNYEGNPRQRQVKTIDAWLRRQGGTTIRT